MSLRDYYGRVVGKSIDHPDNDPDDDCVDYDNDPDDDCVDYDDDKCPRCFGDGMDPQTDYVLPCPVCQSEQRAAPARRPILHLKARTA
jgi:hypothetical protein